MPPHQEDHPNKITAKRFFTPHHPNTNKKSKRQNGLNTYTTNHVDWVCVRSKPGSLSRRPSESRGSASRSPDPLAAALPDHVPHHCTFITPHRTGRLLPTSALPAIPQCWYDATLPRPRREEPLHQAVAEHVTTGREQPISYRTLAEPTAGIAALHGISCQGKTAT